MKIRMKIDIGEGPLEVETSLSTIVAWERKFKRKASDLSNGVGIEDLAFLAHEACKKNSISVPLMLDEFINKLVNIEVLSEETPNPTERSPIDAD